MVQMIIALCIYIILIFIIYRNLAQPLLGDCPPTNNNAEIQAASTALHLANITG
jgi:hypothetical protein